jgi:phospholipid/cholesterol/gamma-HCH transport system permease protein
MSILTVQATGLLGFLFTELGRYTYFVWETGRYSFYKKFYFLNLIDEMNTIGSRSLSVLVPVSAFVGMNLCVEGFIIFKKFGAQDMVGMFVAVANIREMSPLIAGLIVGAKAGTQMAARIATMRISNQLDAMEAMGVNPYSYMIVPRVLGAILVMPLLVIVAYFMSTLAAYVVAVVQLGLNGSVFIDLVFQNITIQDIYKGMVKGSVFGGIVATVSCYSGFTAKGGARGVGVATNLAVVRMATGTVFLNIFLTELMFMQP